MRALKEFALLFCLLGMLASFQSCKTADETVPPNPPSITFFGADATEIFKGVEVVLSWNVSNAASVEIDNGIGPVAASGSVTVQPPSTTSYTLTARNSDGMVQRSTTVNVRICLVSWNKRMKSYGCPYVEGMVQNIGDKPIYNVKITWSAYNGFNTIIDTANGFPADLGTISPGVSAMFEAIFFSLNSWNQIDHLTYTIDWITSAGTPMSYTERVE